MKKLFTILIVNCPLLTVISALIIVCLTTQGFAVEEVISIEKTSTDNSGCQSVNFTIKSDTMNRQIDAVAILPPGYAENSDKSYPVLYALHGRGAPYDVYSNMSRMKAALKTQPMIVVSFSADRASWYQDATEKSDSKFTTFFFEEYVPAIEAHFKTNGQRAITGFSMGGYGSLHYMALKPDFFVSVSGLSTAVNVLVKDGKFNQPELTELFGENPSQEIMDKLQVIKRIEKLVDSGTMLPPIYQHIGTEDFLIKENRQMRDTFVKLNADIRKKHENEVADIDGWGAKQKALAKLTQDIDIDFVYIESPGTHNWAFWHGAIADVINFHYTEFVKDAAKKATK